MPWRICCRQVRVGTWEVTPALISLMFTAVDTLEILVNDIAANKSTSSDISHVLQMSAKLINLMNSQVSCNRFAPTLETVSDGDASSIAPMLTAVMKTYRFCTGTGKRQ